MKRKCEYCSVEYEDTLDKCPNCSAPNEYRRSTADGVPKTIEELKQWYTAHNLPPEEVTRFFIGENYKNARAFGIYKDENTGLFVVYKNKADGTRAIRYEGTDEDYAVNELYLKLKEEIQNQKNANALNKAKSNSSCKPHVKNSNELTTLNLIISVMISMFICFILKYTVNPLGSWFFFGFSLWMALIMAIGAIKNRKNKPWAAKGSAFGISIILLFLCIGLAVGLIGRTDGYYNINQSQYYKAGSNWYVYDGYWTETSKPVYSGNLSDYYEGQYYDSSYNVSDFSNTDFYSSHYDNDDWDSGSDWSSSDSWDSGGTDWDSDW